ncbi:hypothetical protein ACI3PL_22480, partial [Lacticaseibacillus paracasei]
MGEQTPEIPPEPTQPAPEIVALMEGQQRLTEALGQLVQLTAKTRKRTPVRDKKTGDILHI